MKKLERKIMRGIYYAYALRTVSLPGVWQGAVMFAAMLVMTKFVSLGNVIHNISVAQVGGLDTYFYNAVTNTEAWTLLAIGVFVFALLSFRVSISPKRVRAVGHTA
jgi:hypothetical protein